MADQLITAAPFMAMLRFIFLKVGLTGSCIIVLWKTIAGHELHITDLVDGLCLTMLLDLARADEYRSVHQVIYIVRSIPSFSKDQDGCFTRILTLTMLHCQASAAHNGWRKILRQT